MTDEEMDLFAQAFLLPPPAGFTEAEKKQILDWIKSPSAFLGPIQPSAVKRTFFTYEA